MASPAPPDRPALESVNPYFTSVFLDKLSPYFLDDLPADFYESAVGAFDT
jgi:hypothetical protein